MDRRKALKDMGMALGYVVTIPTLLTIAQSCKSKKVLEWTPEFFSKEQGAILTTLVDLILPKTDTPSASEVQVHIFIDRFAKEVFTKEQQHFTALCFDKFTTKALKQSGKQNSSALSIEDLESILALEFGFPIAEQKIKNDTLKKYAGENISDDLASYAFAKNLREMTIWGYKTSEYIGENVLSYLPIPGEYIPCEDVDTLTQGKSWSL